MLGCRVRKLTLYPQPTSSHELSPLGSDVQQYHLIKTILGITAQPTESANVRLWPNTDITNSNFQPN